MHPWVAIPGLILLLTNGVMSYVKVVGMVGQPVVLPCTYTGKAATMCWGRGPCPWSRCTAEMIWTNGYSVTYQQSPRYSLKGNIRSGNVSLTIDNPTVQDSGLYCCRIERKGWFNDRKLTISLEIKPAPLRATIKTMTTWPTTTTKTTRPTITTKRTWPTTTTKTTRPTTTTKRTRPTVTTKRTRPTVTTKRTRPTTTAHPKPGPTKKPQPGNSTKRTRPTVTTKRTRPTVTTKRTRPTVTTKRTRPTVTTKRTRPTVTTKRTRPTVTTKRTRPTVTTKRTRPTTTAHPKPGPTKKPQPGPPTRPPMTATTTWANTTARPKPRPTKKPQPDGNDTVTKSSGALQPNNQSPAVTVQSPWRTNNKGIYIGLCIAAIVLLVTILIVLLVRKYLCLGGKVELLRMISFKDGHFGALKNAAVKHVRAEDNVYIIEDSQ
uniref:LOW QUALITY PROTEIN: hepatitis A virus cellular receptor 1 n=1 Tax=Camelus bactrianus TaxID=9837 RepID=A0A9W3H7T7_CAMBA|nr:LOW QUALITY PROTEIN: hepatitis A virus cellular receptor 1 [Camelus bactrianus]